MKRGTATAVIATMLFALIAVSVSAEPTRFALVIGNAEYTRLPADDQLRNPLADARDITAELEQLDFKVDLLTNAGLQEMEDAMARFGEELSASKDSVGFFYYAGHGVRLNGNNYLIPSDAYVAGPGFLDARTVQLQSLLETIQQAGNRLNIVVLDACRNNPFTWSRGIASRGLSVVGPPQGTIIAYAAAAGKTAEEGSGPNGVYTGELLRYLGRPGLDILDMFRDVGQAVSHATGGTQQPAIYTQFNGNFYLAGRQPIASGAPQPVPAPANNTSLKILEQQRSVLVGQLADLKQTRAHRARAGGILSALGLAGGGVAVLCYFLASNAMSSYLSAATASDASRYHSEFQAYGGLFLGSAVVGTGLLIGGLGFLLAIPSPWGLEAKIHYLDAQIQAGGAVRQLGN